MAYHIAMVHQVVEGGAQNGIGGRSRGSEASDGSNHEKTFLVSNMYHRKTITCTR